MSSAKSVAMAQAYRSGQKQRDCFLCVESFCWCSAFLETYNVIVGLLCKQLSVSSIDEVLLQDAKRTCRALHNLYNSDTLEHALWSANLLIVAAVCTF